MSSAISAPNTAESQAIESKVDLWNPLAPRLVFAIVCCTFAGLLWLGLAGKQAAIGRSIAKLDIERRDLLERRVNALLQHAEATAPQRLEARALELGFIRSADVVYLPVQDPVALPGPSGVVEPLTISRSLVPAGGIQPVDSDVSAVLVTLGAAAPASADERGQESGAPQR